MARARLDPHVVAHLEWIGFLQPTGLVVSAPALVRAGAILDRRDAEGQQLLREQTQEREFDLEVGQEPWLPDFEAFADTVLGWSFTARGYAGTEETPIPSELEVVLHDFDETLRPDFAVRELDPGDGRPAWQLLVKEVEPGQDFDRAASANGQLDTSPHGRMERLLRRTGVPAGLLFNGRVLRLMSAPHGESSGWMDFRVADMAQTAGRPICTALRLLLGQERLLSLPRSQRLAALLEDSRKFQNEVSERLAEQVLHALYELLRGFQAAHNASNGKLLLRPLAEHPDEVYRALLTVLLRIVFLLYAEERGMLPQDETWLRHYSLAGLYERLREDAALFPDTMEQRHGAWAQLLVLFRMFHDGAVVGEMRLPERHGALFAPDRFPFLEGRMLSGSRQPHERITPPRVPDGTIYGALDKLLVLDGERISYRALDVEQIGSVYETMMGFRLQMASGQSVAIRAVKKHGAPIMVDLGALLAEAPAKRAKWLQDRADRKLTGTVSKTVKAANSLEDLHAALLTVVDPAASPDLIPQGAMVLQPSEERRRSGSHYTPRSLTEPIVRTTLEPILARLRDSHDATPRPEQILDLKVCDVAMGSGAFLVETCRQLGEALIEAWHAYDAAPTIPPDEDEVVFARRLIAQRCLYGVDRNSMAVDLAKVSLWLVTLAKDHALTFVDHALQHGDSLVGLSSRQLEAFHWDGDEATFQAGLEAMQVREHLAKVSSLRQRIREAGESVSDTELRNLWDEAQPELLKVRLFGDLVLAAWFKAVKSKERKAKRGEYATAVVNGKAEQYRQELEQWRHTDPPVAPFHWEIEFPEVFERENPGFDAVVGNPPFAGKNSVSAGNVPRYPEWLKYEHKQSHGNADLVAHFFRRAFNLLRRQGAFGLIATNTIGQGDTRSSGLRWICKNGGEIFSVQSRVKWPGLAAVVVSVLHVGKGMVTNRKQIDGRDVERITAFLFHRGGHDDPARLKANAEKSFQGSIVLGMGFTFDDTDKKGVASPLSERQRLIEQDPRNREAIFPYIGGEEVNNSPTHAHHRYVINFRNYPLSRQAVDTSGATVGKGDPALEKRPADPRMSWSRATEEQRRMWLRLGRVPHDYPEPVAEDWQDLLEIVEKRVKPERMKVNRQIRRDRWWQFGDRQPALYAAIAGLEHVLVVNCGATPHLALAFLPARMVFANSLDVFPYETHSAFCVLQSRPHEIWARFFSSSLEDRLRYAPSDCFETFPFPDRWDIDPVFEAAGRSYYDFRSELMIRNDEGLTKTYNRFHDPYEEDSEIEKLRELHAAMDRAVLDAYGWTDIPIDSEFLLDYEIDEEEWGNKKKPYRYRWPDEVRDEVLIRLLELNAQRAAEEVRLAAAKKKRRKKTAAQLKRGNHATEGLFA